MHRYLLQNGIEFLQFHSFRGILFVFNRNIAAGAGFTAGFMLGTFQNHLNPAAFLCHLAEFKILIPPSGGLFESDFYSCFSQFLHHGIQSAFVDGPDAFRRKLQLNPLVFFRQEKALVLEVGQKPAFRFNFGMRNTISCYRTLTGHLTYSGHTIGILDGEGREKFGNFKKEWGEMENLKI